MARVPELPGFVTGADGLYKDIRFPACKESIFVNKSLPADLEWLRPKQWQPNARFISGNASRFDLDQGQLGNCWFVAAAAAVACRPALLEKVVLPGQSFDQSYNGLFRFRFWRYGEWLEVVVDDRLPVRVPYGCVDRAILYFCRNREDAAEMWPALLEKAYAKLNGSYEALHGGKIMDALVDLTGGASETIDLTQKDNVPRCFFRFLCKMEKQNTLLGCSIPREGRRGRLIAGGLRTNHAYCITKLAKVNLSDGGTVRLIRLLNPWGRGDSEWTGDWSDRSSLWDNVSEDSKQALCLRNHGDGEFWMEFSTWRDNFTEIQMCHITPEGAAISKEKKSWRLESLHGSWVCPENCTDCKYHVRLSPPEHTDSQDGVGDDEEDSACTLVVSLMQKLYGDRPERINYSLFKITEGTHAEFMTGAGSDYREVCHSHVLPPAEYYVSVSSDRQGQFYLRLVTDTDLKVRHSGDD